MVANIQKIKECFRAVGSFVKNFLSIRVPLWLWLVVCLVSVLLFLLVACNVQKSNGMDKIDSAVVGFTEYRGHSYLVFYAAGSFSVCHDPECICKVIEQ